MNTYFFVKNESLRKMICSLQNALEYKATSGDLKKSSLLILLYFIFEKYGTNFYSKYRVFIKEWSRYKF